MMAMIHHDDGELQLQIGRGVVQTVTDDGRVQLEVQFTPSVDKSVMDGLKENRKSTLANLVIRPAMPLGDV